LGPDTEYTTLSPETWYRFDESRKDAFYQAASRYFPALEPGDLSPDQVGVRPKIQRPGEPIRDFIIAEESGRGLPGVVNLIGIESPGLTCARVIAEEVFKELGNSNVI
jgi:L-2-hydroxyglutarate oxidase LhgO